MSEALLSGQTLFGLPTGVALGLVAVAAGLTVFFTVLTALLERSGHIRLRHWAEHASPRLRLLWESSARFHAYRFLISLCARLSPVVLLWGLWTVAAERGIDAGVWLAPLLVALLLVFVEWLNRWLVEDRSEAALQALTPVYRLLHLLLTPFLLFVLPLVAFVDEREEEDEDEDEASDDEIDAYIDVGRREGILEPEEEALVRSIVDFGDTQVRSIMTPRVEINSASCESTLEELARRFFESKNSRLPLFRESIDQVVGILHIRDLFEVMHAGQEIDPVEICQQPLYVPESKPLPILLEELQERHQQMAIVVDEYGGVAGLVTVEDLVEEIVGDIRDEHEARDVKEPIGGGRWRLAGRIYLEELEEIMGLRGPEDVDVDDLPYETVSGLICGEMGNVPQPGDTVEHHGLVFEIEEADDRRVLQVAVGRKDHPLVENASRAATGEGEEEPLADADSEKEKDETDKDETDIETIERTAP